MTEIESEESISGNEETETETATEEISTEITTEGNLQETEIPKENIEQAVTENESEKDTEEIIIPETEEEIRNSLFPEESLLTRLESGRKYSVQILEGESVWFFFDVAESGEYHFVSEGAADTRASLYNAAENMLGTNNDRTESDKNFDLTCYLEAGNRYYLETALAAGITGSYQVSVEKVEAEPETEAETETESEIAVQEQTESNAAYLDMDENEVTNLYINTDKICLKEFVGWFWPALRIDYRDEGQDYYYWQDITSSNVFYDSRNHETKMSIISPNGEETLYSDLKDAESGEYTLYGSCAGKTIETSFKLISLEEEKGKATELDLSKEEGSQTIISGYENFYLYRFTVPESDWYYFNWDDSSWTSMEVYKQIAPDNWERVKTTGYYNPDTDMYLEKGTEYYASFSTWNKKDTEVSVSYARNSVVKKLEWTKSEIEIERNYKILKDIKNDVSSLATYLELSVNSSYEYGDPKEITFYNRTAEDSKGNELKWSILDSEGQDIDGQLISEGTYTLKVEVVSDPQVFDTCELHVKNPENVMKDSKAYIHAYKREEDKEGSLYYYLSPEKTGTYAFTALSSNLYCSWVLYSVENIGNDNSYIVDSWSGSQNDFVNVSSVNCQLEAGKDYWLEIHLSNSYYSATSYTVQINESKKVQSISVVPETVNYQADNFEEHFVDWKFKFVYEDGSVEDNLSIKYGDIYGNTIKYEIVEGMDKLSYPDYGSESSTKLLFSGKAGNYKVKFKCGNLETGEYSFKLGAKEEISVEAWKLNQEILCGINQTLYRSYQVPEGESGYYLFKRSGVSGKNSVDGNEVKSLGYASGGDMYYLDAGKKYTFEIQGYTEDLLLATAELQKMEVCNLSTDTITCQRYGTYIIRVEKSGIYNFKAEDLITGTIYEAGDDYMDALSVQIKDNKGEWLDDNFLSKGEEYILEVSISDWMGTENPCKITAEFVSAGHEHNYETIIDQPASCGSTGSQHKECTICHEEKDFVTIPATGKHTYQTVVDKAATCGAAGSQHEECKVCHAKKASTTIAATGKHNYQIVVDKAATCGAAGSQHKECTVCHKKEAVTAIPATGKHTYGTYKTVKAATVLAAGTEERTCSVCGNKESRSIKKLTAKISVSYKSVSVVAGSSVAGPKVTYAKGDKIASWKTSNKAVATVDKNGKITGKKAGTATITVTLKSKKTAKIKVTVKKKVAATRVKLNKTSLTLKKGKSFQLKATVTPKKTTDKVTYKTSNKNIVTVTSKGKLVAKKKGKATITVMAGKKKATCRVTVK